MAAPTNIAITDSGGVHNIALPAGTYVLSIRCGKAPARVGRKLRVIVDDKSYTFPDAALGAKAQDDVSSINIA